MFKPTLSLGTIAKTFIYVVVNLYELYMYTAFSSQTQGEVIYEENGCNNTCFLGLACLGASHIVVVRTRYHALSWALIRVLIATVISLSLSLSLSRARARASIEK